jgi:hypothetical protein
LRILAKPKFKLWSHESSVRKKQVESGYTKSCSAFCKSFTTKAICRNRVGSGGAPDVPKDGGMVRYGFEMWQMKTEVYRCILSCGFITTILHPRSKIFPAALHGTKTDSAYRLGKADKDPSSVSLAGKCSLFPKSKSIDVVTMLSCVLQQHQQKVTYCILPCDHKCDFRTC